MDVLYMNKSNLDRRKDLCYMSGRFPSSYGAGFLLAGDTKAWEAC
jgi:hypothetical protein